MIKRTSLYAHIYFDVNESTLDLLVYSWGRIPGFSEKLSKEERQATGFSTRKDIFTTTMQDLLSLDQIQSGAVLELDQVAGYIKELSKHNSAHQSKFVVDLDDITFWDELFYNNRSSQQYRIFKNLDPSKKQQLINGLVDRHFSRSPNAEKSWQDLYLDLSRMLFPSSGSKYYRDTTKWKAPIPPTFIISSRLNKAFYPGYRGAQQVGKQLLPYPFPEYLKKNKYIVATDDKIWGKRLLEEINRDILQSTTLGDLKSVDLDKVLEILAKKFYLSLAKSAPREQDLTYLKFENATNSLVSIAQRLLIELDKKLESQPKEEEPVEKTAAKEGTRIGIWIDLNTGKIFDSKEALISAIDLQDSTAEERTLAASVFFSNKK